MVQNSIRSLLTALRLLRSPIGSLSRCLRVLHKARVPTYRLSRHDLGGGKAQKNPIAVLRPVVSSADLEETTLNEQKEKKLSKRRKAIQPLLVAAQELGDQEIIDTLSSARDERNATVQKQMIHRAAKRLNDSNALTERKDAGSTVASSSARPPAPSAPVDKKRTLESPKDALEGND